MLNENSDGTVLCRYGVRWARAGCCRNKSFMNNSVGMYNTNTSNGGFVMSEKIYLKIDQKRYVKKPKVTIGDVMTVYCSDKDMIEKIGHITLVEFTLGKYDRKVLDALDVVGIIQKEYPDADIECLGECDFVVEYKKPEKEGTVHWIKVAVICFMIILQDKSCQKHQHRLRLKWINMTKIYQNLLLTGKVENDSGYYFYRGYVGSVYCCRTFCTYNQRWCY